MVPFAALPRIADDQRLNGANVIFFWRNELPNSVRNRIKTEMRPQVLRVRVFTQTLKPSCY